MPKFHNNKHSNCIDQATGTEKVSQEFTEKTDLLLEYIERTYLADGFVDTEEGRRVMAKIR